MGKVEPNGYSFFKLVVVYADVDDVEDLSSTST